MCKFLRTHVLDGLSAAVRQSFMLQGFFVFIRAIQTLTARNQGVLVVRLRRLTLSFLFVSACHADFYKGARGTFVGLFMSCVIAYPVSRLVWQALQDPARQPSHRKCRTSCQVKSLSDPSARSLHCKPPFRAHVAQLMESHGIWLLRFGVGSRLCCAVTGQL